MLSQITLTQPHVLTLTWLSDQLSNTFPCFPALHISYPKTYKYIFYRNDSYIQKNLEQVVGLITSFYDDLSTFLW